MARQISEIPMRIMMVFQIQWKAIPQVASDTDSDGTPDFRDTDAVTTMVFQTQ